MIEIGIAILRSFVNEQICGNGNGNAWNRVRELEMLIEIQKVGTVIERKLTRFLQSKSRQLSLDSVSPREQLWLRWSN